MITGIEANLGPQIDGRVNVCFDKKVKPAFAKTNGKVERIAELGCPLRF
jgi:hypothetical protein